MEKENNKEQYRAQLSAALDKLLELSSKESGWTIAFDKHNVLATARQTKVLYFPPNPFLIELIVLFV